MPNWTGVPLTMISLHPGPFFLMTSIFLVMGPTETEHVFLRGNDLPNRWRDRARFAIGELWLWYRAKFPRYVETVAAIRKAN